VAFLTDNDVAAEVADALGLGGPTDLPAEILAAVHKANLDAQADIVAALVGNRGYTYAQAQQWDQAGTYNGDIATYYVLIRSGGSVASSDAQINRFDRRKDLMTAGVTIGNVAVDPGDPAAAERGGVGSGAFDTSGMTFGPDVEW
jgi:hypothetical protein